MSNEESEQLLSSFVHNGNWLDAQTFPPLNYAVQGIFTEGYNLLAGAPKIGKSWLALSCALSFAQGSPALGSINLPSARPVLYLALEDTPRRLQDRTRALLNGSPIPQLFHFATEAYANRAFDVIRAWLDEFGRNTLVLIDTYQKVATPPKYGEQGYGHDYAIGGNFKRLAQDYEGVCLIVVHHVRKAGASDFVDGVSGTNGIAGSADTVVVLNRARQDNKATLSVTGRDISEAEFALTFNEGQWQLMGGDLQSAQTHALQIRDTAGLGATMAEVVKFVSGAGSPVTIKQVSDACQLPTDTTKTYLSRLVNDERLTRSSRGLYAPVTSVTWSPLEFESNKVTQVTSIPISSESCSECGELLAQVLLDTGETTHPSC
jgi:hypothetical protein